MIIKTSLRNLAVKALCESMTIKLMVDFMRELVPDYNLHRRFNLSESISIPQANAAKTIVTDICDLELFPSFVQLLIDAQNKGFKGRKYRIAYLSALIRGLELHGYIFDHENNMFIEDARISQSKNWGVIREGIEYEFTFLRFDIAGNSRLVRLNETTKVTKAYQDFFNLITKAVVRRNGRIWQLEGDGGLAAFAFQHKDTAATLSAHEILVELLVYNHTACPLSAPLLARFAIHAGRHIYTSEMESLHKSEPIKEIKEIENRYTKPNSCSISNKVLIAVDKRVADLFSPLPERNPYGLACYSVELS